jgi:hypothetical protein
VQPEILDILYGELHIVYVDRVGGVFFVVVVVVKPLAFVLHFLNLFWNASRLVCSLCDAMAGSLPMTSTAVSSAKIAVIDSGEVDRSAVYYIRHNNGPRTLAWGTPALTRESSVHSISAFTRKCLLCK